MQSTDFLKTERDGPQYQGMLARNRGSMGQTQPGPFKNDWGPIFPCSTARESDVSKWFNCMALESDFFFLICRRSDQNTRMMTVSMETARTAKYRKYSKNKSERSNLSKTNLPN